MQQESAAHGVSAELEYPAPPVSCDEARSLARSVFALDVKGVRALPGERDRNFWLREAGGAEFALRVIHPAEDPAVTAFQTLAMLHVATADPELVIPRVISPAHGNVEDVVWQVPASAPRRLRCVSYLQGQPLYKTAPTAAQRRSVGRFLARLDRALAGFRHAGEDHRLLWDLKRADRALHLVPEIPDAAQRELLDRVLTRFAQSVKPRLRALRHQTVHNDFNPHNILTASDNDELAGVIDFGDMVRGPLIQDLATASAYQMPSEGHPLLGPAQVGSAFHATYPLSDDEISLLPDLIITRLGLSGAITSWRAVRHPDNANYILRNAAVVWLNLRRLIALSPEDCGTWLHQQITRR